ncbi:fatty acyl-CoA reductase wat-like [Schistocerca serialis cubense]|uniref:fatty acyl-CoA reductase wat-like n=1 Tax=Schistocerca serialis cubense TaxID=2023355 RepID=UPI00214E4175|nr:fatty acyl-CoA reductase wat-like [Schistocerca serialis cubense]
MTSTLTMNRDREFWLHVLTSNQCFRLWNMYSRIHGVSQALEPFTTREWTFKDDNFASLLGRMGAVDRKLFPCDIVDVDWEWFISNTVRGLRLYLLNESFDTLEAARKRYRRLVVVNQTLVATGGALLLFKLWQILVAQIRL